MKKFLLLLSILALPLMAYAAPFVVGVGGTGTSTPSGLLYGDNGATTHLNTAIIGSGCTFSSGTLTCTGTPFPFTSVTGYNSTSTVIAFLNGLFSTASSTFSSNLFLPSLSQGFLFTGSNGLVNTIASSSIKLSWFNNDAGFVTSSGVTDLGSGYATTTNAKVTLATTTLAFNGLTLGLTIVPSTPSTGLLLFTPTVTGTLNNSGLTNSTISGIALGASLNALTATDNTLTFSGSYNGGTARTVGLNLGNANTWTALQSFSANASTTGISAGYGYFGGTSTTTISSTGAITSPSGVIDTFPNASTTNLTAGTSLQIPTGSNPSPTVKGYITQSTNSPYQIQAGNNAGGTSVYDPRVSFTFGIATSTAWTGTTTAPVVPIPTALKWTQISCATAPAGSTLEVGYQYENNTAPVLTYLQASSTNGVVALTSNNTPSTNATSTINFGNPASSPTSISCTLTGTVTGI